MNAKEMITKISKSESHIDMLESQIELVVIGGFAIANYLDNRETEDIDYINKISDDGESFLEYINQDSGVDINNAASFKFTYGTLFQTAHNYINNDKTIELRNIKILIPKLEYLIAAKAFDSRIFVDDINQITYRLDIELDKELLIKIIKEILAFGHPRYKQYYKQNSLKLFELFKERGWDTNEIPNT